MRAALKITQGQIYAVDHLYIIKPGSELSHTPKRTSQKGTQPQPSLQFHWKSRRLQWLLFMTPPVKNSKEQRKFSKPEELHFVLEEIFSIF